MDKNTKISRRDIIGKLVAVSIAIGAFVKLRAQAQATPTPQATPTIDQKTADYVSHPVFGKVNAPGASTSFRRVRARL